MGTKSLIFRAIAPNLVAESISQQLFPPVAAISLAGVLTSPRMSNGAEQFGMGRILRP
jgi:hypothetical protein